VELPRQLGLGRAGGGHEGQPELLRRVAVQVAEPRQQLAEALRAVDDEAGEHLRSERMQGELERAHDAEVAAAAAQRPEQVGVLGGRRPDEPAVRRDDRRCDEVVAGQAVLALEPAGATAQREAGDARRRDAPAGGGQAVALRGTVDLCPGGAPAHAGDPRLGVDRDVVHPADVEDEPVLAQREARHGVATAAHGDAQVLVAGEGERRDHVVGGVAAGHVARAASRSSR
jgi:hypothetical protein